MSETLTGYDPKDEAPVEEWAQSLEPLLPEIAAATRANDREAVKKLLMRSLRIRKQIDDYMTAQENELSTLMNVSGLTDDDARVEQLLGAFVLGGRLRHIHYDVLGDEDGRNRVTGKVYEIPRMLDSMTPKRRPALADLLDHPHPDVRAMAAGSLLDLMPERAVPVLEEIHNEFRGTSAGLVALFATMIRDRAAETR
ncbi:MAG TPA: hypothetical protein VKZ79_11005 [Alphaproteobacteria bacterium]|nr:hypothetical protein [Alphaproteobacteria bacterium]